MLSRITIKIVDRGGSLGKAHLLMTTTPPLSSTLKIRLRAQTRVASARALPAGSPTGHFGEKMKLFTAFDVIARAEVTGFKIFTRGLRDDFAIQFCNSSKYPLPKSHRKKGEKQVALHQGPAAHGQVPWSSEEITVGARDRGRRAVFKGTPRPNSFFFFSSTSNRPSAAR